MVFPTEAIEKETNLRVIGAFGVLEHGQLGFE
jgi:hypothetical protein